MIPIKIGSKKYSIKPISELNTAEFIELSKIENLDFVKYIAWQTSVDLDKAFFAVTSKSVENAIGVVPDVSKLPKPKGVDYSKIIQTVGQRHQIETCGLEGYELVVFILAVAQACSNNIDEVDALRGEYMKAPFNIILPAGFFFLKNLEHGRKFGLRNFVSLLCSIKIPNLRRRRVLIG